MKRLILEANLDINYNGHHIKVRNDYEETVSVQLSDLNVLKPFIKTSKFKFVRTLNLTLYRLNFIIHVKIKNTVLFKLGTARKIKIHYLKIPGLVLRSMVKS